MGDIYMLKLVNEETLLARPQAELLLDNVSLDGGYITMWWPGYPNWPLPDPWKTAERSGGLGGYDPSDMIRAIDSRLVSMEHRLIEIADVLKDLGYRDQPDEKAERQKEKKAR